MIAKLLNWLLLSNKPMHVRTVYQTMHLDDGRLRLNKILIYSDGSKISIVENIDNIH